MMGYKERHALAGEALASLDDVPKATVEAVGWALVWSRGDLERFGSALVSYAQGAESLPRFQLSAQLQMWALPAAGAEELLERLEDASRPPWEALRAAIETVRSGCEEGMLRFPVPSESTRPSAVEIQRGKRSGYRRGARMCRARHASVSRQTSTTPAPVSSSGLNSRLGWLMPQ